MVLAGAELLLYPTAIGSEPHDPGLDTRDPWRRVMIGHAVANATPVAAANRIGTEDGQRFYGSSFIADQRGDLLVDLGREEEAVGIAAIDLAAVRRYREFLSQTYLPAAREALGVSANPNGRACYDAVVRQFSTVSMPADQVYAMGWQQIRALDEQMRPLAARLTGTEDLARAMHMVNTDSRFAFRTEADVIAYAQAAQDRASAAMPRAFGLHTTLPVQIQPYPEFRARAGAPGQYQAPPEDGSRPPIHLLNTWDPTHKSRASIESTTFHETWPGHHQQIMVAREAKAQHRLVRTLFNSGFGEGWALYAERVADEMELYSGELDRFGYLSSAKFRSARMVIDSGIHTRGMSYDEAFKLLTEQSTLSPAQVRGEVNRYISWPGQAPSYMIGNLEILRLRDAAKEKLGAQFDLRAFHDQVLGRGSVTLPLLRELVEEWIATASAVAPQIH